MISSKGTTLLKGTLKIPIYIAEDPLSAVARGTGIILEDMDAHRDILIDSQDDLPPR